MTKIINDRKVSESSYWWAKHRPKVYDLQCIHRISLKSPCERCKAEIGGS